MVFATRPVYTVTFTNTMGLRPTPLMRGQITYSNVAHYTPTTLDFASSLQTSVNEALSDAGYDMTIDVSLVSAEIGKTDPGHLNGDQASDPPDANAGKLHIVAHSPSARHFTILIDPAIKPDPSASRWSMSAPPVKFTYDPNAAQVSVDRDTNTNIRWTDAAFQELGLTVSPVAFDYTNDPTNPGTPITTRQVEIILHITESGPERSVPVTLGSQVLGSDDDSTGEPDCDDPFKNPDSMACALQEAIDSALVAFGFTAGDVKVCRANPDVTPGSPDECKGRGNLLTLQGKPGTVTAFSIEVRKYIDTGDSDTPVMNGAITELGFMPGVGEKHQSRANKFFLDNVDRPGRFEVIVPNASAQAHFSFLAITAEGSGTLPGGAVDVGDDDRLVNLALTVNLKNPLALGNLVQASTTTQGNSDPSNLAQEEQVVKVPQGEDFTFFLPTVGGGERTDTLASTASNMDVKTAIEGLHAIGSGNVDTVNHSSEVIGGRTYTNWDIMYKSAVGNIDQVTADTVAENRLELSTLGHALSHGKLLYSATDASPSGDPDSPPTGFIEGVLTGGLGLEAMVSPDGALKDLANRLELDGALDASLEINATSSNWFTNPAFRFCNSPSDTNCVRIDFTGPDFQRIIDRFQNLDLSSIIQALRAIINFLRTIDGPSDNGIAKVLDTKLPLVDRSISDILDIAQKFADKVEEIANDPAGSVQELNNILAAALGEQMASVSITPGGVHHKIQDIAISDAIAGKFKLTFKNATTRSIAFDAAAKDKSGTIAAASSGVTSLTYTASDGIAPAIGDKFVIGSGATQETVTVSNVSGGGPYTLTVGTTQFAHGAGTAALIRNSVQAALEALKTIGKGNVAVTIVSGHYHVVFQGKFSSTTTDLPDLVADTKMLVGTQILDLDTKTGVLNFSLDFPFSVGLARPFSFDLGKLAALGLNLPPAISAITSFVSLSASGNLDVNASATIHLRLGLDLAGPIVINTSAQGSAVDEIQTIKVSSDATGTFKLHYTSDTGSLNPGISAADMQTALEGVAGSGNVTVSAEDVFGGTLYTVNFTSGLGHTNVAQITANTSSLTTGTVVINTKREGSAVDEVETLRVKATAGTFTVTYDDGTTHTTPDLQVGISQGDMQTALRNLVGDSNVNGRLVVLGYGNSGVFTDLGRIGAYLGISSTTTAVLRDGDSTNNEVAAVTVIGTGGNFKVTVDGTQTGDIAYGASDSAVAGAIGSGIVDVVKTGATYLLTFKAGKAHSHVEVSADGAGITGTAPDITFTNAAPNHAGLFGFLDLPISVGTQSFQVPIDFLDLSPGTDADGQGVSVATTTNGNGTTDEVQTITVGGSSGQYQLDFGDETTSGIAFDASAGDVQTALEHLPSIGTGNVAVSGGSGTYTVHFQGTQGHQDADQLAPEGNLGDRDNHRRPKLKIHLKPLLAGDLGNAVSFSFELPGWDTFDFQLPSIFALLSDPGMVIDGLDGVFGAIQDILRGQIFGAKLPLLSDALANNPLAADIGSFRVNVLQKLAKVIKDNNLDLDHLVELIQKAIFAAVTSVAPRLLKKVTDASQDATDFHDVGFNFLDAHPHPTSVFTAKSIEFDFKLAKTYHWSPDHDLKFDIGIPALGINGSFRPQFNLAFAMNFGFGLNLDNGFYFVTDGGTPDVTTDDTELSLAFSATFSHVTCSAGTGTVDRASINGNLLFLALHLTDGVDMNGDGKITAACTGNDVSTTVNPQTDELTGLYFAGSLNIQDPNTDGMLTMAELVSAQPLQTFQASLAGGAVLRTSARVDFSTLGGDFGNILPAITAKILLDFALNWKPGEALNIAAPQVIFADITLDLGSFISKFAKPIFDKINDLLSPLSWLIGPDGFLNKRIPLLSDLAGHKITGKDLIVFFDPDDGPKVVGFLNFVDNLFYLSSLIKKAASEANVGLNFGDLVLFENSNTALKCNNTTLTTGCIPDISKLSFVDREINLSHSLPGNADDLRNLHGLDNVTLPDRSQLAAPAPQGNLGPSSSSFTAGVSKPGAIYFKLLEPATIFKLMLGQPADLVIIQLPEFGFSFFYRQQFPIIGPLVGTFAGGVSATVSIAIGYDTTGLIEFMANHNAASLLDGFFISELDPVSHTPRPQASLHAEIAVGAAISLGLVSAGVEGGIAADIFFTLSDLDKDGKVRLSELGANLLANDFNPIAVFDISGVLTFFLRAYVDINLVFTHITLTFEFARLKLLDFTITFKRPAFMGTLQGGVLTLAIGPSAHNRLQGDVTDISESIFAESAGAGKVKVWSPQFNRDHGNAQEFEGVTKIVADGGAGDDTINLAGINDTTIAVSVTGGDGNDKITGPTVSMPDAQATAGNNTTIAAGDTTINFDAAPTGFTDGQTVVIEPGTGNADTVIIRSGSNTASWELQGPTALAHTAGVTIQGAVLYAKLSGGPGNDDIISSSALADVLDGGDGNDTLEGQNSKSILRGGPGDGHLTGGAGGALTMDRGPRHDTLHDG